MHSTTDTQLLILCTVDPPPNQMSPVTCLSSHPDGGLVVSGHIDGTARLYSISNNNIKVYYLVIDVKS